MTGKAGRSPPPSHVVESKQIRVTRALRLNAASLQLYQKNRLRVAVYSEFFPVAYRDGKKMLRGFDVDLIEAFSREVGLSPPTLVDPIRAFPADVTGVVAGTMGSTGMKDAADRLRSKFGRLGAFEHIDERWKASDEQDLKDLLDGKVQGLMRGSFVGKAIVAKHPKRLGMAEPWDASTASLTPYGREVFAFPCRRGSGLVGALNAFLVRAAQKGVLAALAAKHGMV